MRRRFMMFCTPDATGGADGSAGGGDDEASRATDDAGTGGGDDNKGGDAGKVTFTAEQQAHIDALVVDRVERAKKTAKQQALDEAKQQRDREQMDELDRVKAEKADAEKVASAAQARLDGVIIDSEAKVAVLAAGVSADRLEKALRLLDLDGVEVVEGKVDGAAVTKAVEKLKAEIPELFTVQAPARSGGDFSGGGQGKRSFTTAEVKAMSPAEYAEHREEIMAAMREGRYGD
jgi:hypothetical protein